MEHNAILCALILAEESKLIQNKPLFFWVILCMTFAYQHNIWQSTGWLEWIILFYRENTRANCSSSDM